MNMSPRHVRRSGSASTRWSTTLRSGLAALGISCALLGGAQRPISAAPAAIGKGQMIRIGGYEFEPLDKMPTLPQGLRRTSGGRDKGSYFIVQFVDRITPVMRQELDQTGAVILHFVHENSFIVRADASAIGKASSLPSVCWIGPYEPAYAMSPTLDLAYDEVLNDQMKSEGTSGPRVDTSRRIAVSVLTMERTRVEEVAREAEGHGGRGVVRSEHGFGLVRAEIPRAALESLARRDGVLWIERELPAEAFNDVARWTIQSFDSENLSAPVHEHGVTGVAEIVTVTDTGADNSHVALAGKVSAYYTPPGGAIGDTQDSGIGQHGTHVAGSVAGDAGTPGQYDGDGVNTGSPAIEKFEPHDGQAFGAMIHIQDISTDGHMHPASDLSNHYGAAASRNSWINTNRWGFNGNFGQYTNNAVKTDEYIWNHPSFTVLFAAGNAGRSLNKISPYATAKNMITVGSSGNGGAAGKPRSRQRPRTDRGRTL